MKQSVNLALIALIGVIAALCWQVAYVGQRIQAQTSAYICIEAWKLSLHPQSCDKLLNKRTSHDPD